MDKHGQKVGLLRDIDDDELVNMFIDSLKEGKFVKEYYMELVYRETAFGKLTIHQDTLKKTGILNKKGVKP